ncbi:MAG: hypothetical protein AB8H47_09805 [Bacteroidia bacterium]
MKTFLIRLSFLPFALAIFWGAKTLWQQIDDAPTTDVLRISAPQNDDIPTVQLALALDISGSMDGLIDQAQTRIWNLVNELSETTIKGVEPRLELALYIYGGDHLSPERAYVRQLVPFTTDIDEFSEALFALSTNGGEEYSGAAIEATLRELAWRGDEETLKLLFIAGNESFNQGTVDFTLACAEAKERGIHVNTIFCGPFAQGSVLQWQEGAELGGGQYLSIDHNLALDDAPTPYDDQFGTLNSSLNETYLYYGDDGALKAERNFKIDGLNSRKSISAQCNRTSTKAGSQFNGSLSWDLVEASAADSFAWNKVDYKTLPKNCQELSLSELQTLTAEKRLERERIQAEIIQLTQKRSEFLANLKQDSTSRLDDALIQCLHKQASAKGYEF